MLGKLRSFSKGKLATVLVAIIIVPFVFWGMGSVFSVGNTNSIAKINNHNVSTQDLADFVNNSKISKQVIKEKENGRRAGSKGSAAFAPPVFCTCPALL